jgi:hypothetical protein
VLDRAGLLGDDLRVTSPAMLVALRPLEIKQLFDFAIRIYRQRFSALFLAIAMVQLPLGLVSIVVMIKVVTLVYELQQMTGSGAEPDTTWFMDHLDFGIQLVLYMLGAAAYQLLIMPLGTLACSRLAVCALHGTAPSLRDCLRFALKRYWPTQVALATYALPLLGLAVLTLIFVLIAQATGSDTGIITASVLGLILIFFGVIATVLLYFRIFPALIGIIQAAEELPPGGMASQGMWLLRRAWELTTGQFWRMLGLILLAAIAINFISKGIAEIINYLVHFISQISQGLQFEDMLAKMVTSQQDPLSLGISMTLTTLVMLIFPPFFQCYQLLLYYDLRCRKEAYDLELLLDTATLPPAD